jgi:hypothetical protein
MQIDHWQDSPYPNSIKKRNRKAEIPETTLPKFPNFNELQLGFHNIQNIFNVTYVRNLGWITVNA